MKRSEENTNPAVRVEGAVELNLKADSVITAAEEQRAPLFAFYQRLRIFFSLRLAPFFTLSFDPMPASGASARD